MARRVDACDLIVAFFENAPLNEAALLFSIVRGIVARRQPKATTTKPPGRPPGSARAHKAWPPMPQPTPPPPVTNAAPRPEADTIPAHVKTTKGGLAVEESERP